VRVGNVNNVAGWNEFVNNYFGKVKDIIYSWLASALTSEDKVVARSDSETNTASDISALCQNTIPRPNLDQTKILFVTKECQSFFEDVDGILKTEDVTKCNLRNLKNCNEL